ncbi:MAG TPA: GNAT family N-acetyltransferase [Thermoanaerobaculia bacterium]|nr:GNAT family N-acetyltransferase [Thermoanaerobaculia bacterium]
MAERGPADGAMEVRRGVYVLSTDPARLDLDVIHEFLANSYWGEGITRQTIARSIAGSMSFGLYHVTAEGERQVGLARVITDRATFAYLSDVFVLEAHRGRGLGVWLIETIIAHPELQGLRRWALVTRDAHSLYRRFGWTAPANPSGWMERLPPGRYGRDREPASQETE